MASETRRAINIPAMSVTSEIALLRALAAIDRTLGIVWHYSAGDDGGAEGLRLEWPDELARSDYTRNFTPDLPAAGARYPSAVDAPILPKAGPHIGDIRVIRVSPATSGTRPLYPEQPPLCCSAANDAMCQKRPFNDRLQ